MKKLLALVLALIMVLGLSVSAFAATSITLTEVTDDDDTDPEIVKAIDIDAEDGEATVCTAFAEGGYAYIKVDTTNLKNLTVEATGNISAELVEYDPTDDEFEYEDIDDDDDVAIYAVKAFAAMSDGTNSYARGTILGEGGEADVYNMTYEEAEDYADDLNDACDSTKWKVIADPDADLPVLLKLTLEKNYTAAYKKGVVTLSAYNKSTKKDVSFTLTVITDVVIFAYEDVKDAAAYDIALNDDYDGYSDYDTALNGYVTADLSEVTNYPMPKVVSTTAFRAIAGEDLTYEAADGYTVEISNISTSQKGVNFSAKGIEFYDKNGDELDDDDIDAVKATFGFLGSQVIASDFTITLETDIDWFELREKFGNKLEEEDVITYYILKDGKLYDKVTVDYADIDPDEDIEMTINGKAGETLGFYTIQLTAPASEDTDEENPNTGAESMVSVIAALAVVAAVSAAAISLKKY